MLRILQNTKIDFIRLSKITSIGILAFLLPAFIWIAVSDFRYSVEFTGGTLTQLEFQQAPDIARVRSALTRSGAADAEIVTYGSPRELVVRAQEAEHVQAQSAGAERVANRIQESLTQEFGAGSFRVVRTEAVGPRVGAELRRNALIAMLISFAVSLMYLAWRFDRRLGLAAVIANIHDILATFAFIKYANLEISLFVVGGILTVIGYSLTDKVVVFDRVREIRRRAKSESMRDVLNRAVNETLPRTVMTGTTVIACLLALIVFGGEVLRSFALVLLFGIGVGTFSSIYVAGPVLLWIEKKWPRANTARPGASRSGPAASAPTPRSRRQTEVASR
jgi:preprotein translocase subunit SecF